MTAKPVYVWDTSAFIAAWSENYPIAVFPKFWERVDKLIAQGRLVAPVEVRRELGKKDDDALTWLKGRVQVFQDEDACFAEARQVLTQFPRLTKAGADRGAADPFVVALAMHLDAKVITKEAMGGIQSPKIPNACVHFGVSWGKVLDVILAEGWRF